MVSESKCPPPEGASPWWQTIPLADMSTEQWESLCDGCGQCCRIQLEDDEGNRAITSAVCQFLDIERCQCSEYERRQQLVPHCWVLTPENLSDVHWMPDTCAYRLIYEAKPLPDWHPLITGHTDAMHSKGHSVRDQVISETLVRDEDLEELIVRWYDHP